MKRNSRTENFQWTFEGISAAREFRRNIELLTAGEERLTTERQTRLAYEPDTGEIRDDKENNKSICNNKVR